jgi:hypothetical protein
LIWPANDSNKQVATQNSCLHNISIMPPRRKKKAITNNTTGEQKKKDDKE